MNDIEFAHPDDFDIAPLRHVDEDHFEYAADLMPAAERDIYLDLYRRFLYRVEPYDEPASKNQSRVCPSHQAVPKGIHALQFSLDNVRLDKRVAILDSMNHSAHDKNDNCVRWLASDGLLVEMRIQYESVTSHDGESSGIVQCWEGELFFSRDPDLLKHFAEQRTRFDVYWEYGDVARRVGRGAIAQRTLLPGFRDYGDSIDLEDQEALARILEKLSRSNMACSRAIDPLWLAMQVSAEHVCARVQELVNAGVPLRIDSLRLAIHENYFPEVIRVVSTAGADLDWKGIGGDTLLHMAACNDDPDAVEALLICGADPKATDLEGATARDMILAGYGSPRILSILDAWSARQSIQQAVEKALGRSAANPLSNP